MKHTIYIICVLLIALLFCYCKNNPFDPPGPPINLVSIQGFVSSESVLLDSVKITFSFSDDSTFIMYTDSQGFYQIKIPPGTDLTLNYYRLEYEDVNYSFRVNNDTILYTDLSPIDYYPTTVGTYWKYIQIFKPDGSYEEVITYERTVTRVLNNSIEYSVHKYGMGFYVYKGDTIVCREVDETYCLNEDIDGSQNIKTNFSGEGFEFEYIKKYLHEGCYLNTLCGDEQYSNKYFFQYPLEKTIYKYSSSFKIECLTTEILYGPMDGINIWIANNIGVLRVETFSPGMCAIDYLYELLEFQPGP